MAQVKAQERERTFGYSQDWKNGQPEVFANFRTWAEQFAANLSAGNTALASSNAEILRGLELARDRRKAFAELIEADPQRALAVTVPASIRKALPAAVLRELETRVSGIGDFTVSAELAATGGPKVGGIRRVVAIEGQRYRAFVFGRRLEQQTKLGIPLHGVAIDDVIALAADSIRELEPGETRDAARQIIDTKLTGPAITSPQESILAEIGPDLYRFPGRSSLTHAEKKLEANESGAGPYPKQSTSALLGGEDVPRPPEETSDPNAWTTGNKNILIIRVDFSDLAGDPRAGSTIYTAAYVQNLADTQIKPYYASSSYNLTSLTNTVTTQLYRLPQTGAYYATSNTGNDELHAAARSAASANFTLANYDRIVVLFSSLAGFSGSKITYGGLASIGGPYVWVNGEFDFRVVSHELGHTYGLYHAGFWEVTDGNPISSGGTMKEYGDDFDTMGANYADDPNTDFNPYYKNIIGWIANSQVQTVTTNGTYRVFRFDNVSSAGTLALKVVKDNTRTYWVGCRRNFTSNPSMQNGAYIIWGYGNVISGPGGGSKSALLDMTTPGNTDADAALAIGATFNDANAGVSISPVSEGGSGATRYIDIQVTFSGGGGGGQELLTNGGFEAQYAGWTVNTGDILAGSYPHGGSYYAYLGNSDSTFGNLFTTNAFTIPSNATAVTLSFWLNITSEETDNFAYDTMNVSLVGSNGSVPLKTYSNVDKSAGAGNPYYSQMSFDLNAYKGQSLKLYFDATTDASLITTFRIDDVSLKATVPSASPTPTATATATVRPSPTATATATPTATATATPITVTVQALPSGRAFTVDGTQYTAAKVFSWTRGSSHSIATTTPQSGSTGTRYLWTSWSDGGAISHSVAPSVNATYTANFTTQYQLTMNGGAGGTVTPVTGNWYDSGSVVPIGASVNKDFVFNAWSGAGYSGTQNPANVAMNAPISETGTFTQIAATPFPIQNGAVFGIIANVNQSYVTAEAAGASPLIANRPGVGAWEQFQVVDQGNGYVALRSMINGKYVCADNAGSSPLIANRDSAGTWEQFQLVGQGNGNFSLIARANGRYVCADNNGTSALIANRPSAGLWETFHLSSQTFPVSIIPNNVTVLLQAVSNGRYVTAESAGSAPLAANRTQAGLWEQLRLQTIDASNGIVALRSTVNGMFVTAENAGTSALIANRNTPGLWEQFQLVNVGAGNVALRASANGLYVSAGNGGDQLIANRYFVGATEQFSLLVTLRALANEAFVSAPNNTTPLIANQGSIGLSEQFQFVNSSPGYFSLKARSNGMYVCADNAGNNPLIANRSGAGLWEQFQWIAGGNGNAALKAAVNGMFVCAENAGQNPLIANRPSASTWEQFH
jgi:hypothetical protein